jgi:hypothetical protein
MTTHTEASHFSTPPLYYDLQWCEARGKLSCHIISTFRLQDANSLHHDLPSLCLPLPIQVTIQIALHCQIIFHHSWIFIMIIVPPQGKAGVKPV